MVFLEGKGMKIAQIMMIILALVGLLNVDTRAMDLVESWFYQTREQDLAPMNSVVSRFEEEIMAIEVGGVPGHGFNIIHSAFYTPISLQTFALDFWYIHSHPSEHSSYTQTLDDGTIMRVNYLWKNKFPLIDDSPGYTTTAEGFRIFEDGGKRFVCYLKNPLLSFACEGADNEKLALLRAIGIDPNEEVYAFGEANPSNRREIIRIPRRPLRFNKEFSARLEVIEELSEKYKAIMEYLG
jgi:hypothetical protein